MKELGEQLNLLRKSNGVTIDEASHDLGIDSTLLESIEKGNFKVFKDVYELKKDVKSYAKYLGMDPKSISDEFDDYLFEKTSKISLEDIKEVAEKENKEDRVSSPYTEIKKTKYDFAPIVLAIVLLFFISLVIYLGLNFLKNDEEKINRELCGKMEDIYELAQ